MSCIYLYICMYLSIICIYLFVSMCVMCVCISLSLSLSIALSESSVVFANAARRDAGFFNVFLLRSYFLWVVWVGGGGVMLMFLGSVT